MHTSKLVQLLEGPDPTWIVFWDSQRDEVSFETEPPGPNSPLESQGPYPGQDAARAEILKMGYKEEVGVDGEGTCFFFRDQRYPSEADYQAVTDAGNGHIIKR